MTTQLICCLVTALVSVVAGFYIAVSANSASTRNKLDVKTAFCLPGLASVVDYTSFFVSSNWDTRNSNVADYLGHFVGVVCEGDKNMQVVQTNIGLDAANNNFLAEGSAYALYKNGTEVKEWYKGLPNPRFFPSEGRIEYEFMGVENGISFGAKGDKVGPGKGFFTFGVPSKDGYQSVHGEFDSPVCKCHRIVDLVRVTKPLQLENLNCYQAFEELKKSLIVKSSKVVITEKRECPLIKHTIDEIKNEVDSTYHIPSVIQQEEYSVPSNSKENVRNVEPKTQTIVRPATNR